MRCRRSGSFGTLGGVGGLQLDTRDSPAAPQHGVLVTAGGSFRPGVWDAVSSFGEAHGEAATYLGLSRAPLRPVLALRVGAKRAAPLGRANTISVAFTRGSEHTGIYARVGFAF